MDRISALRNVEEALADFERGEEDLATVERRVRGVVRTYATEYREGEAAAYRIDGEGPADGLVVVATSPNEARRNAADLVGEDLPPVEVERLGGPE